MLKDAGYTTGVIGKWGLWGVGTKGIPNLSGFDYFFGYLSQLRAHNYYPFFANNEHWLVAEHGMEVPGYGEYGSKEWPEAQKGWLQ